MTLRNKLLTAFGGLAATALLAAAVALYVSLRWQATSGDVERHYLRSLIVQQVRAETFQALAEVNDALAGDPIEADDARRDFERAIEPTSAMFSQWTNLADSPREAGEVRAVKNAQARLIEDARRVFAMIESDRRSEAVRFVDDQLDTGDYAAFRALTERIVVSDQERRRTIRAGTEQLRRSASVMATIAIMAAVSLTLLIAAYLASDLFRPLQGLRDALDALARGDSTQRLDADRNDEIGSAASAFNRAAEAVRQREAMNTGGDKGAADWREAPSRLTLHRLIATLQTRLTTLRAENAGPEVLAQAEESAAAIAHFAAIGFPLDLRLERCDPRLIAQEALTRFGPEIANRGISCELNLDAGADRLLADRLKLREAVEEMVRNALGALPVQGGRIGVRVQRNEEQGVLQIDVADGGRGMDGDLIERAIAVDPFDVADEDGPQVGLTMVRAVVERHGGTLALFSEPGQGTVARLSLPMRA